MAEIRVDISGWTYPPWRGNFYPQRLTQQLELACASRRFNAIEINGTFYSFQRPSSFQTWYAATPPGFVFALKGGRFLTHMLKLKNPQQALANFFASGLLGLREKLGPILWQFPAAVPGLHSPAWFPPTLRQRLFAARNRHLGGQGTGMAPRDRANRCPAHRRSGTSGNQGAGRLCVFRQYRR